MIPTLAQPAPRGGLALPPRYLSLISALAQTPDDAVFCPQHAAGGAGRGAALPVRGHGAAVPNFWPLVFSWACGLALAAWGLVQGRR